VKFGSDVQLQILNICATFHEKNIYFLEITISAMNKPTNKQTRMILIARGGGNNFTSQLATFINYHTYT